MSKNTLTTAEFKESYAIDFSSKRGLRAVELKSKSKKEKKAKLPKKRELMSDSCIVKDNYISIAVGMVTGAETNDERREHWRVRYERAEAQKQIISVIWKSILGTRKIKLPCKIKFTRFAPRTLDKGDNLNSAFKYVKDQICNVEIGVDDKNSLYNFDYAQWKSKQWGIQVEVWENAAKI